jgi:hypothetical protein
MLTFLEKNLKKAGTTQMAPPLHPYTAPFAWRYYAMLVYEHAFGSASHHH